MRRCCGPRLAVPDFDAATLPGDLDDWLAGQEAAFPDIVPGAEKRILWAGAPGAKTPLALVYIHGFSATSQEIRPVPDLVAADLGANLFLTRLNGHGRGGAALAGTSADRWIADLAEALAIGARIGERVVVIATSTGAPVVLAGLALPGLRAAIPAAGAVAGVAMVSPNFRLASRRDSTVLDLPGASRILPWLAGAEQDWPARNADHARFWTLRYPTRALIAMARAMRAGRAADAARLRMPLLLLQSPDDVVVDPGAARRVLDRWGGPVRRESFPLQDGMDPEAHVIAGAIRSPGMTGPVARVIADWARGL